MAKYIDDKGLKRFAGNVDDQINNARYSILNTKGKSNGIASLDGKGFVPLDQLGNLDMTFFEPVQKLPTKDIKKHIYLIKNNKEGKQDTYDEYLYTGDVNGEYDASKWEKLGDFVPEFDLEEYALNEETVTDVDFTKAGEQIHPGGDYALRLSYANGDTKKVFIPNADGSTNGHAGFMSSGDKAKLDEIDTEALSQSISNANTAASDTNAAIKKCETATAGAEKCNVTLEGTKIIVTNRNGEKQETEVVDTEEVVTVVITSSVESISVAGLKVNVFLNNGKTPQTYTTDSEGKTTFKVSRGVYYQVVVPEYANAQPLSPIGFTSVGVSKTITFNYEPYDEETSEKVIVTVTQYTDGKGTPWEGKSVIVTIDKKATTYTTDEKGQATIYVPYLKEYTVRVDDEDGYYVRFNKNSRTYTSRVAQRLIQVNMYQFKTGIYVLDSDATEYYIDDWLADGKSPDDAVAIRVAEQQLLLNGGSFLFRVSDLKNLSKLVSRQWCTQNIQFNSIALNGNNVKDENYYRGETSTFLIRQEAEERSLSILAFDYAWNQELVIGNQHLRGFLMSVGQEYIHIANRVEIGEVLRKLFGDEIADAYLTFVTSKNRWTSTQFNATYAWCGNSQAYGSGKNNGYYVLPVFAC